MIIEGCNFNFDEIFDFDPNLKIAFWPFLKSQMFDFSEK